jgi:pimeloyl-ACP methyl ester carboxylesterase
LQSFYEAHLLIDELVRTDRNGPSFHVVVPSLVGYGFSGPPPRRGWTLQDTARLFDTLMTKVLPYESGYLAHGGDWGHVVTRYLSFHPSCKALHTMVSKMMSYLYDEFEVRGLQRGMQYVTRGNAYFAINSTTPATIGYGMYQSPVAILSYLLDKFQQWTDPRSPAFQPPGKGTQSSGMTDENIL